MLVGTPLERLAEDPRNAALLLNSLDLGPAVSDESPAEPCTAADVVVGDPHELLRQL